MMVQVLRPFSSSQPHTVGDVLDATDWPANRVRQMTRFRYIIPVLAPVESVSEELTRGRALVGSPGVAVSEPVRRGPGRPRKHPAEVQL